MHLKEVCACALKCHLPCSLWCLVPWKLLAAGFTLLIGSPHAPVLAQATAWISVPVFVLTGIVTRRAGWPITAVGILFPLLLLFGQKGRSAGESVSKT